MRSRPVDSAVLKSIGERVREARKARKLTQEQLADRLGTKGVAISRIESGKGCSLGMVAALAHELDVPVAALFSPERLPLEHWPAREDAAERELVDAWRTLSAERQAAILQLVHAVVGP